MTMGSLVVVEKLTVSAGSATLVDALSFTIRRGEVLALIGESGSGKTTIALALMGHARRGCRISGGSVRIGDVDVLSLDSRQLRALRGRTVSYVAQSAAAVVQPVAHASSTRWSSRPSCTARCRAAKPS